MIVGTVPAVTIAPITRGIGGKISAESRYFEHYTRPWISEADFEPERDPHLTSTEARWVDSAIDAFNGAIIDSVEQARRDGLDWYVFELGGLLDSLATKRYITYPAAQPTWWKPYPLPPELAGLDPVPNTRFFASGPEGRTDGGLFSLDGIHPTTISSGVIAHEVMAVMNLRPGRVQDADRRGQALAGEGRLRPRPRGGHPDQRAAQVALEQPCDARVARRQARLGEVDLLSPACAVASRGAEAAARRAPSG